MTIKHFQLHTLHETHRVMCDICGVARTGDEVNRPYYPEQNGGLTFEQRMKDVRNVLVKYLVKEGWLIISRKDEDELVFCPICAKHTFLVFIRSLLETRGEKE